VTTFATAFIGACIFSYGLNLITYEAVQ
jgi:hypothetical protein